MKLYSLIIAVLLVFGVFYQSAHAYLDPGTGSLILQMLVAGIVGALFFIKLWWGRIKAFFKKTFLKEKKEEAI